MRSVLLLLLLLLQFSATAYCQPVGFEEEILPSGAKVNGHVKSIKVEYYYLNNIADTLATGTPWDIATYKFDTAGRLIRSVYHEVKYKHSPHDVDDITTYRYYGRDSIISSNQRGKFYIHKIKTINKYDAQGRLVMSEFYVSQYPKHLKPEIFLASVTNFYDDKGFLVKQVHRGQEGQNTITTLYENDERGNHIKISPPTINVSAGQKECNYKYDLHNNPIHSDEHTYDYVYDDKGNWIKLITRMNLYLQHGGGIENIMKRVITYY